jgi:uncharacterized protein
MAGISFDAFINLVKIDKELYQLSQEKDALVKEREQLGHNLKTLDDEIERDCESAYAIKKSIADQELELRTIDSKERERKEQLADASTAREYFLIEQELKDIKKRKSFHEEQLFALWQKLEGTQQQHEQLVKQVPARKQQIQDTINSIDRRFISLDAHIKDYTQERNAYYKQADPELLSVYETMKEQVHNPVVPLKNNTCPVCFYMVTQHDLQTISKGQLLRCKDCYRLLYGPERQV